MRAYITVAMFAVATLLSGCGGQMKGPNIDTLKQDLVGKNFFYKYKWGSGGSRWQVQSSQIVDLQIQARLTDRAAGTEEIHALTTLSDGSTTIKGVLAFRYKKYDQGWALQDVDAKDGGPGKSFSFDIQRNQ